MAKLNEIYFCKICRNLAEIVNLGGGSLVCCGNLMDLLIANTHEGASEKHVPVVVDKGNSVEITVGSVEHPMQTEHYIAFIEVLTENNVLRKMFKPGDKPSVEFPIKTSEIVEVREFCNLHMLWKK